MDTDGNGIGDLPDITEKPDYIKPLGVTPFGLILCLSPVGLTGNMMSLIL
jgi:hypothetical protein